MVNRTALEEAGWVDVVETTATVFQQTDATASAHEKTRTATALVRGATAQLLDDGTSVLEAPLKDARLVPGACAA